MSLPSFQYKTLIKISEQISLLEVILRSEYLNNYGIAEYLVSKQRFNKWMDYGVNYKEGVITRGRDTSCIFIVIS